MLSETEIQEIEKIAQKSEAVKLLFDYYKTSRTNGMKKLFVEMNKKFSDLADNIRDASLSLGADDKTFERFMKIAVESGTMQDNYSKMEAYMFGEKEKEEESGKSFTDKMADKKRNA